MQLINEAVRQLKPLETHTALSENRSIFSNN